MRKIMVVDDEKFIRLGLKSMIERNTESSYDITLCRDGNEALEILKRDDFDIVITDIRMPEMTGLELLENIKGFKNKPEVVFLSGYNEFDYAVQALVNGARNYLLKPIDRNILYETLEQIEQELVEKEIKSKKERKIDIYEKQISMNELKYILTKDSINEDELRKSFEKINIKVLKSDFYIGVITSKDIESDNGSLINEYIQDFMLDEIIFLGPKNEYILISNEKKIFNKLEEILIKEEINKFTIGLSELCNDIKNIKEVYEQGVKASKYKLILNECILIEHSNVKCKICDYKLPIEEINKLYNIIGTQRDNEIDSIVDGILDLSNISKNNITYIEEIGYEINKLVCKSLDNKVFSNDNAISIEHEKYYDIYNFNSIKEYKSKLKRYIFEISTYIKNINSDRVESGNINKAIRYINDNYNKDITMATVSNEVSLNYSYFSHVFKERTGDTFVNYLRGIRIEKAKELLIENNMKIYEVSKKVGYEDSKQFSKIFRKYVGISPIEYKEKNIS